MKKLLLIALFTLFAFSFSANAQEDFSSSRLNNLSNQLKRHTVDLVDRTYDDLRRGYSNSRREIEAAFLAQQFDASAGLFQQMVRDNRPATELREAVGVLNDLARRAPNFGSAGRIWRDAKDAVDNIERELGGSGGGNNGGNNGGGQRSGTAFWRGTVDNRVQLIIRGRTIETRTVAGRTYPAGTYSFTATMPNQDVNLEVDKKDGRGNVRVIQQPSRRNNYTGIVEIEDSDGGARQYQLEISW